MHNVLNAHGTAMDRMRARGQQNLGIVLNLEDSQPADASAEAAQAADRQDAIFNRWFLGGVLKGEYPQAALEGLAPHLPEHWQDDMARISQPLDWLGINYYTRSLLAPDDGPWPATRTVAGPLPKTEMGWEIYPEGLERLLTRVARDYSGPLPLYVTENGMAAADSLDDTDRIAFIDGHIGAVRAAIDAGAPIAGSFVWSLLDNYEWAEGYAKRFGVVRVDFDSLERQPKASYQALKAALARS
jgi:beta-glucosidase